MDNTDSVSCYVSLYCLQDLHSSKNLTNEMRRVTSSNAQQVIDASYQFTNHIHLFMQVIEFECRRLGITAPIIIMTLKYKIMYKMLRKLLEI